MKLLALDTSSVACSVALQKDADIAEEHVVEAKAHTRLLMPMLKRVLEQADCRLTDLDDAGRTVLYKNEYRPEMLSLAITLRHCVNAKQDFLAIYVPLH